VDIKPSADHTLELLWGSKQDRRGAVVEINGHAHALRDQAGDYNGFQWKRVPVSKQVTGSSYDIVIRAAAPNAAFLAGARLVTDEGKAPSKPKAIEVTWPVVFAGASSSELNLFEKALSRGKQASQALDVCDRFVTAWLRHADPETGLLPDRLPGPERDYWDPADAAADNWPFMVLTSALTDRARFHGRMQQMLETERRLTTRRGALSDMYSFTKDDFLHDEVKLDRLIFRSSEYAKDGLMPITNWLGKSPWSRRLVSIIDAIWQHAPVSTDAGPIPSRGDEVNGEMMQITSRLYWMTGNERYLDRALRLADWYLLGDRHPTKHETQLRLRDHGCELISGLSEVYFAAHHVRPEKAEQYKKPMHTMLDRILKVGLNKHGMMYDVINPKAGKKKTDNLADTWGYNYNAFYTVYMLDGTERYRDAVRKALGNLNAHYRDYVWEGGSADGVADSLESAINLYNREPVTTAVPWMDHMARKLVEAQRPDGIIEGWHGDGNTARTLMMYALWKQQGVTARPWRPDLKLGAAQRDGKLYVTIQSDWPWEGKLIFDSPRHKTTMKMPEDYPRINQFPEWFTVQPKRTYVVDHGEKTQHVQGSALSEDGLQLKKDSDQPIYLKVD
jgi:hypothetical protein